MIHHDYLLRLIEQFTRALAQLHDLRTGQQPQAAARELDHQLQAISGADRASLLRLSVTEILARILRSGTSQDAHVRGFFVVTLLKESGDLAAAQGQFPLAQENHLKALDLLLHLFQRDDPYETPSFAPTVDALANLLPPDAVPPEIQAQLMHHYERLGRFADAENALFNLIDVAGPSRGLHEFGCAFYQRILEASDATLGRGNLPRQEALEGLADFQRRTATT